MIVKKILRAALLCLLLSMSCGCAALLQNGSEAVTVPGDTAQEAQLNALRASVETYRSLAAAYETDQQLYKAAFLWLAVLKLNPEDRQARQKVANLEERIRRGANQHLVKAREHANQKSYLSARNDFLMALAYDPNCEEALAWLKNNLEPHGYTLYETKQGDTIRSVAQQVYLDPGKDFIVAYFSGLKGDDSFKPQTVLRLPVIESQLSTPEPRESRSRYVATPAPQSRAPQSRAQRVYDKAGAEEHYRRGVSYFIAEDLPRAIREWEETMSLDPEHSNARRDIEKARKLLRNGRVK